MWTVFALRAWCLSVPLIVQLCEGRVLRNNLWDKVPGMTACPEPIETAGDQPHNWTLYSSLERLLVRDYKPKFLDFNVHMPLDDSTPAIRAATSERGELFNASRAWNSERSTSAPTIALIADLQLAWADAEAPVISSQAVAATKELQVLLSSSTRSNSKLWFVHYGDAAVGLYLGSRLQPQAFALTVLEELVSEIRRRPPRRTVIIQGSIDGRIDEDSFFGVIADVSESRSALANVHAAVRSWARAEGLRSLDASATLHNRTIWVTPSSLDEVHNAPSLKGEGISNSTLSHLKRHAAKAHRLIPKATCRTIQAVFGDGCPSLATKCGISGADFTRFNPSSTLCSSLKVGQHVCCSAGTLPDFTPKPNGDGSCATYVLEKYNKNTWGWSGCDPLYADNIICLSPGEPPMPRPIANAVCGPQVPGTIKPSSGTNISELNPCPLNACCDVWGQCGITAEFCTPSGTGAPGTAAKNTNGCISNCGTRITNNGKAPAARISIAYFEAWNRERPCLWKDVSQVDAARFTHIHFAFAKITPQYTVDTSRVQSQLDRFVRLKGIKRIVAFGGWADSTSVDSYYIFRQGVKPGNRLVLARNLANFVKEHGLDGVDIDWEYPGAQDLPDIPPAEAIDGEGYVAFLTLLRALLPSGTSLSIAAPASYWYLKNYPIKRISEVVDYIVYMTYDLHGQWDYANQWSIDGCPAGNCLRSHVNLTETMTSLAMITKAGVATNKIVVGVSSYGRSFKMSKAGCYGPMCTFEGPKSGAKPGICTGEPGYISNAEINEIVSGGAKRVTKDFLDEGSHSRIIVYDDTHYVAFMDEEIKSQRTTIYKILNFAGTSDWADDLREFSEAEQWTPGIFTEINSTLTCGWRSTDGFNCMKDAVKDVTMDQTDRWRAVKTDCAWREFAWDFKFAAKGMYLPAFASGYFDGPEGFNCEEVGGCVHNVLCIETVDSGPAGSFILNSFVEINKALKIFFDGIISAQTQMNSLLGAFSETFAPELTNDGSFNIVMDIFGLTFTLLAGPVFNNLLKARPFFDKHPTAKDNLKDTTYNFASWGLSLVKDAKGGGGVELSKKSEVGATLGLLADGWKAGITKMTKELFAPESRDPERLYSLIVDGKLITGGGRITTEAYNSLDIQHLAERIMYAALIPRAWLIGDHHPFVLDSGLSCGTVGPYDYEYMEPSTGNAAWTCVDDKLYYLLTPASKWKEDNCGWQTPPANGGPPLCIEADNYFVTLPGTDQLQGQYGDITLQDIVAGSIATYKANGNRNGGQTLNPEDRVQFDYLWNDAAEPVNIKAPGIINIPVCSAEEAYKNWEEHWKDLGTDHYPCN